MQALSSLWSTEARSDRNNMAPRAALKFWASAGIRMPWIEPLTWAYVALSVFVYAFLWVDTERAAVLTKDWVAFVIGRNLAIYFIFYGGAHHFLYESTLAKDLAGKDLKWNPKYPGDGTKSAKEIPGGWAPLGLTLKLILTRRGAELSRIAQHSHDRFWCLTSCVVSSLIEVYFIHAWASGSLPVLADSEVFGLGSVAHLMVAPFWRTVHFYAVHRAIHSKLLYLLRKILALNDPHKSAPVIYINVFRSRSGLSMHPIESFLYFTCALTPLLVAAHPVLFLFIKLHADISPIPGHHGYQAYKGQQFHWLHHHYFECNYGSDLVPCDHILGTYRKDSAEIERVKAPAPAAQKARDAAEAEETAKSK